MLTGDMVGPYRVLGILGEGGMGEVYRARDAKLNRDVAIKVLLPAVANDHDRLARFRREAQVLASLNHPNIAAIYGLEEGPAEAGHHIGTNVASGFSRTIAIVMELVEGEDLAQRIARGPIPLDEALPIARQIAEALEAAHDHGIIHRDLKPANIKVREDGMVKVLDFGLAKAMDLESSSPAAVAQANSPTITSPAAMTAAGVILGTAAYMSPDQARGKSVDAHSQSKTPEMPWNPDGKSFAVGDSHTGRLLQFSVLGGGAGEPLLADGAANLPEQWTPDGRGLIFTRRETETGRRSICLLSLDSSPAKWSVIVDGGQGIVRGASLSPDGHWLAYESNESGRYEIYVQAYPSRADRLQVSREGGAKARWAKSSNRLYFVSGTRFMVSLVTTDPDLRSDVPRPVVSEPLLAQELGARQYDIALDGRILAIKDDSAPRDRCGHLDELRRIAPVTKR